MYVPFKGPQRYTVKTTSGLKYNCYEKDMYKLAASRDGLHIAVCCKGIIRVFRSDKPTDLSMRPNALNLKFIEIPTSLMLFTSTEYSTTVP